MCDSPCLETTLLIYVGQVHCFIESEKLCSIKGSYVRVTESQNFRVKFLWLVVFVGTMNCNEASVKVISIIVAVVSVVSFL